MLQENNNQRVIKEIFETRLYQIEPEKIRVCAYVRVSTDSIDQLKSFDNQVDYYEQKIKGNPDYHFCGVFSDAVISGYKENRPGFQAMIKKAEGQEIDLILTKSISRFARNTVTLLKVVRELKALNVGVIFEEQNIHTLSADGELILTILGAVAEEERRSQSESVKLSIRNRFKNGDHALNISQLIGFCKNEEGEIEIDEAEALIIKEIYRRYLTGESSSQIAKALTKAGIPMKNKPIWNKDRILKILKNEKYCGDNIFQKYFCDESGRMQKNRGELPKYIIKDFLPAIISRDDWEKVQQRLVKKHRPYPFSRLLKCPYCGASLAHSKCKRWVYWTCNTKMEYTKKACKGISVPDRFIVELNQQTPITEPMVVVEVINSNESRKRHQKSYRLIPAAEYGGYSK
jgi:DNA invertase Pin-like site-specific DNA recombinase